MWGYLRSLRDVLNSNDPTNSEGFLNEGTKESPVELTVWNSHSGSVNGSVDPFESYYKFTLLKASGVTISISDMSMA